MSTRKKPNNFVQRLLKRLWRSFNALTKALLNWVLRSLTGSKRRRLRQSQAGFVLPTVVMVLLVVALLTTAIVIRSFDRAKNASNFRVDQAVLNAATPALDRAKAKLERLLSPDENRLAGSPPGEGKSSTDTGSISYVLSQAEYTFGDETPLKLAYTNPNPTTDDPAKQTLETVWKFPVDTDNNGKYDTFTLYGLYFRNPPVDSSNGNPTRARTPVEARALPQATGEIGSCGGSSGGATSGTNGWYQTDGQLKKAFFVYVANVPISTQQYTDLQSKGYSKIPTGDITKKFEAYSGNKGFSALEMQQDQARISLDNNAVWYDDDLVISNVPTFRVNGRIHTNSNLMTTNPAGNQIIFYQVSALDSCYYTRDNSQISVGGNVLAGDITKSANTTDKEVQVHLYQGKGTDPSATNVQYIDNSPANATTANAVKPQEAASNSGAFDKRLNLLVQAALDIHNSDPNAAASSTTVGNVTRFPPEVKTDFNSKFDSTDPASGRSILTQVLTSYFTKRIRRVSYKEVKPGDDPLAGLTKTTVFSNSSTIDPPTTWMSQLSPLPPDPNIQLNTSGNKMTLAASATNDLGAGTNLKEKFPGDRILVGNALPTQWLTNASPAAYADKGAKQNVTGINWDSASGGQRQRISQVEQLDDLGDTSRGGFWEQAAAYSGNAAKNYQELAGGLRIVTGAGIYIDDNEPTIGVGTGKRVSDASGDADPTSQRSFLPAPPTAAELWNIAKNDQNGVQLPPEISNLKETDGPKFAQYKVVWPDTMPMFWVDAKLNQGATGSPYNLGKGALKRGDLQMRATVVYHFAKSPGATQEPIACIATLYDPTLPETAQNMKSFTQLSDQMDTSAGTSINGINYPYSSLKGIRASSNNAVLQRQANMIFPDGRWVNKPLKDALKHLEGGVDKLTINDIAAIDAANCALSILYAAPAQTNSLIPDGAIQERTFLDARQIKAIHKRDTDKAGNKLKRVDGTTLVDRQTKLEDITDPAKLKIAELGSLAPIDSTTKKESALPPEYSLPIEQRQPLEIRVTQIDLSKLRSQKVGVGGGSGITDNTEYMLPNTGIIYATRDDALPDVSDPTGGGSATDFKLDPTRRPNGIRLINGETLARDDSNTNRLAEKGLILASDLPVYIKGPFNLHAEPGTVTATTPNFKEEFTTQLITSPAASSYSNFYSRTGQDTSFACRKDASGCTGKGDQWRPARILADAVTLLSSNFRDGYRSEGDFDLNNNAGNLAVEARLKNGFWWNDFATTAKWYDANGWPDVDQSATTGTGTQLSSYLTNGVTPIQRRVNSFPEYLMETCQKTPVSACGPQDWVLGKTATDEEMRTANIPSGGINLENLLPPATAKARANTTAQPPTGEFILFPRRVAFNRNDFGALIPDAPDLCAPQTALTGPNPCKATPIGVNGTTAKKVEYGTDTTNIPPSVKNALWYVTTSDNANPSAPIDPAISYDKSNKLYYPPYDPETVSERQFLLSAMPEFLPEYPLVMRIPSLNNGKSEYDTPDYAVFSVGTGNCFLSKAYKATDAANLTPQPCPTVNNNAAVGIGQLWERLRDPGYASLLPVISVETLSEAQLDGGNTTTALKPLELKAKAQVNIYNLSTSTKVDNTAILSSLEITLDRNGQDNPIFVFRTIDPNINIDFRRTVEVKLKGVDPNNIFWVSGKGIRIAVKDDIAYNSSHPQHKLVGNFIGSSEGTFLVTKVITGYDLQTDPISTPLTALIDGGRILGFNKTYGTPSYPIPPGVMTALTTTDQPLLIPVLQLNSPQGSPSAAIGDAFPTKSINADYWVQRVPSSTLKKETIYNAVFIMGDSPSRPLNNTANPGESGGGLGNFPRFLEAWEDVVGGSSDATTTDQKAITDIKGSFFQFKKSAFATAPFEAIDDPTQDNSLFFDGATPVYMTGFTEASGRPYIYKGGGQSRKAPYYRPPNRQWGYDVGLLTQTPDLFSRRFANPTAGTPNEYFRQVSRDDKWVETLLCAAQAKSGAGASGYDWAIADPKQRPGSCQDATPTAIYND